jgi:predicted nucleic acid-binding Zn ribbon protein
MEEEECHCQAFFSNISKILKTCEKDCLKMVEFDEGHKEQRTRLIYYYVTANLVILFKMLSYMLEKLTYIISKTGVLSSSSYLLLMRFFLM